MGRQTSTGKLFISAEKRINLEEHLALNKVCNAVENFIKEKDENFTLSAKMVLNIKLFCYNLYYVGFIKQVTQHTPDESTPMCYSFLMKNFPALYYTDFAHLYPMKAKFDHKRNLLWILCQTGHIHVDDYNWKKNKSREYSLTQSFKMELLKATFGFELLPRGFKPTKEEYSNYMSNLVARQFSLSSLNFSTANISKNINNLSSDAIIPPYVKHKMDYYHSEHSYKGIKFTLNQKIEDRQLTRLNFYRDKVTKLCLRSFMNLQIKRSKEIKKWEKENVELATRAAVRAARDTFLLQNLLYDKSSTFNIEDKKCDDYAYVRQPLLMVNASSRLYGIHSISNFTKEAKQALLLGAPKGKPSPLVNYDISSCHLSITLALIKKFDIYVYENLYTLINKDRLILADEIGLLDLLNRACSTTAPKSAIRKMATSLVKFFINASIYGSSMKPAPTYKEAPKYETYQTCLDMLEDFYAKYSKYKDVRRQNSYAAHTASTAFKNWSSICLPIITHTLDIICAEIKSTAFKSKTYKNVGGRRIYFYVYTNSVGQQAYIPETTPENTLKKKLLHFYLTGYEAAYIMECERILRDKVALQDYDGLVTYGEITDKEQWAIDKGFLKKYGFSLALEQKPFYEQTTRTNVVSIKKLKNAYEEQRVYVRKIKQVIKYTNKKLNDANIFDGVDDFRLWNGEQQEEFTTALHVRCSRLSTNLEAAQPELEKLKSLYHYANKFRIR